MFCSPHLSLSLFLSLPLPSASVPCISLSLEQRLRFGKCGQSVSESGFGLILPVFSRQHKETFVQSYEGNINTQKCVCVCVYVCVSYTTTVQADVTAWPLKAEVHQTFWDEINVPCDHYTTYLGALCIHVANKANCCWKKLTNKQTKKTQ